MTHNSFKSYIDLKENKYGSEGLETHTVNCIERRPPTLLKGEAVIASEDNVLQFVPLSERRHGRSGSLSVTNFKLSFIPSVGTLDTVKDCQQSRLLSELDVSLCNIDNVYHILRDKKRKLTGGNNVDSKIKGLLIVCKNMRTLFFSFKFSNVNSGKNIANALLHYAFPRRHHLLFAYDFREPYLKCSSNDVSMFHDQGDWQAELANSKCAGWRVSSCNECYHTSTDLPVYFVVPEGVVDSQLKVAAGVFRGNRLPVWCWGTNEGAALVRMADMLPGINDRAQENTMLERVRKAHPKLWQPQIFDLQKSLPIAKDVQLAFCKLREIASPESVSKFWSQDLEFLSRVDSSCWLQYVSSCLALAQDAARILANGMTVVLQEGDGRDVSAIVSCLVQLLCNPLCRSIVGFQSLIQKEWISLGHPFSSRLGLIADTSMEQSPVFLLFLDCVWQLTNQFPDKFEFTETYLTTLWDSCHIGVFDNFLFDSERDRRNAEMDASNPFYLRTIWDWEEQFGAEDIALFHNSLYLLERSAVAHLKASILPVSAGLSSLELWLQCYCRWVPMLELVGGGRPQVNFQLRLLTEQIVELKSKVEAYARGHNPDCVAPFNFSEELSFACDSALLKNRLQSNPSSFFPFVHHAAHPGDILLNTSFLGDEEELDDRDNCLNESTFSLSTAV